MLKIELIRNKLYGKTLKERNKIRGLYISYGTACTFSRCENRDKCKYGYKPFQKWLNNIHMKTDHKIIVDRPRENLSGTTKCPFNEPRVYSCFDCKYHGGYDEYMKGLCSNEERYALNKAKRSRETMSDDEHIPCKFFEKNEYADKFDKRTGEYIYN